MIRASTGDNKNCTRINKKLLRGVQGDGFLEKSPPGCRRQKLKSIDNFFKFRHPGALGFLGTYNGVGVYNGEPAFAGPSEILGISPHHDSDHFMCLAVENGGTAVTAVNI